MSTEIEEKLAKIPVVNQVVGFLKKIKLPGFEGLSIYDLLEMYITGIVKGALTYRASAISFSFFMAIFPFLLFVLNLIPFVSDLTGVENFQEDFLTFINSLLPPQTADLFDRIITDIVNNRRGGLLSSVFFLSIFLMANGINAIFGGFETSYHVRITRNVIKQYFMSVAVALILAFMLLFGVAAFVYFEVYIGEALRTDDAMLSAQKTISLGRYLFFVLIVYISSALLYYFGTAEGKLSKFFSPGALLTTVLIMLSTYLFGIYIENFSKYNELYGFIGALLILMLYIWLNSNVLLLGFELNATLRSLKRRLN
ncbi:YihY/virulence factor BrkB family protein [Zhouia spongiae]|uniref:YihY/virulence factor BrkB family protein n=1 Tax=Zhouia spongiae TaxID=2202721 RepID=A0ABY3YIP6_9FLAO|nr:YihY/virulence factor BrkB family protein [Zhouia spongiae]UNY97699.1 YihY/virulence factor BrkB family protein [Zhouia spongiae]